ncbi:RDD domain containing protein [Abyssogena phaseoliformis symbiont OG214]|uniref:RDD family protein n=1 Tax=Abyssogena phaseoliformis symbiont TaxID=596095 RepID=UPI0019151B72|nr:RDD family protein [Abyssogena phaseoliformis symbiont]MBW5289026.1 putative transmembrane protein [Candidatus Ruthia sp. Apha_13_S6]BBB22884.1 RDD domain containing protein [Abyssogena phaseoliformis symbiont OG214]
MKSDVSLLRRLGAISYDIFLAFSLVFFVTGVVIIIFFNEEVPNGDAFFYVITIPMTYLYFTWSWVKGRQTLGMKAWKFQIKQINGNNITHKQAFIRLISATFSFAVFGLGFLCQLLDKDNRAMHDKISNTILIKN